MQGVGVGACEALGLADDSPRRYACVFLMIADGRGDVQGEGGAGRGGRGQACVWSALNLCDFTMRDVGGDFAVRMTVRCAGNGIGEAGCKALASALAKHSGLQDIHLDGTRVYF
jgi:hypothetical protein